MSVEPPLDPFDDDRASPPTRSRQNGQSVAVDGIEGVAEDMLPTRVLLLCGPPGAGKSTVAQRVAEGFSRSAHLKVDDLREIEVNGFAPPGDEWTDAHERQFVRARTAAALIARLHAADGVTLVIDDVCVPEHFEDHYAGLFADPLVHRVMLKPTRAALERRIRARGGEWDELLLSSGALPWCYERLERLTLDGWTVIDSSDQSAAETIEAVRISLVSSSAP
jgi:predicted kinase